MTDAARPEPPFERLKALVARLRRECPWDRKQTLQDCKSYLLEEVYELVDAITDRSPEAVAEELGDLAFLVVFTAQIARDEGLAKIDEAIEGVLEKMVRRHPHVFGEAEAASPEDVVGHWTRAKLKEKRERAERRGDAHSAISGVPRELPALLRAYKVKEKAARVGFDWRDVAGVWAKVHEEMEELEEAVSTGDQAGVEEEIGDLLITIVNLARWLKVNPEDALTKSLAKFMRRFGEMERALAEEKGKTLLESDLEEMDAEWNRAKKRERASAKGPS
ncbi:MAG: nucleoside triphosphate pyrophosphohydrolase [Candidatus Methylomirabilis sp.]|nr:nucleoside triphosphate pyrophosphohydrolase [Deltaproteobacteria bacterium]